MAGVIGSRVHCTVVVARYRKVVRRLTPSAVAISCTVRPRLMEPGMVWLLLIPFFGFIWAFFIATRVLYSLRNEFRDRGRDDGSDYGNGIGLANAFLGVVCFLLDILSTMSNSPALGIVVRLGELVSIVLLIVFWVKIAGYSGQLASPAGELGR
jgi:hypothetical protein